MKLALLLAVILVSAAPLSATGPLSIRVSPHMAFAPVNIRVVVRMAPDFQNRALAVVADSPDFYRSSQIQLDGDRAPRSVQLEFPGVPGGEYEVTAVLFDSRGEHRAVARRQVVVVPTSGL